ncbi:MULTISPECIES: M48 family metallopeptidase [Cyanophyceae]|uniref:M48 family metallopeptidase n=1 Tax=Cyanophyceae TaxID=3028117 RepID=UPI001687EFBC|nr:MULTISPECIES: M48 family metallopeptidase [Cyanophyceae]MBD1917686.1 M48 family metallopeptidase [Phormidium sp. FACHB-77]MBD2031154.1 M48 family metallopeptidase [Phormidium sp. FACHB-322]MBD2053583.1 M48 family metallopeptidase [Leptolyngbya sp. FACHB-60]
MNFFEHQDQARRNTTKLLLLFGLSIAVMIAAFYGVAIAVLSTQVTPELGGLVLWRPGVLFWVASGTLAFMVVGSSTKMAQLSQGGHSLAKGLGGRELNPLTDDPDEQRLINVVSEMALASGTPIPAVYLLDDEPGINAFAAGHTADKAVIGVTRGCLDQLSRDELQGVIGHEFSHILNGDMGLNLKLIGVIHGLLLIYIAGRVVLRWNYYPSGSLRRSKDDNGGRAILAAALAMVVIGYLGVLCGRLIKSAVSREREFLADASAVQFTRNPEGLTGALRKIGQISAGSTMVSPMAETASHLLFGEANGNLSFLGGWFATHPPLGERLRRLGQVPIPQGVFPLRAGGSVSSSNSSGESLVMGLHGGTITAVQQETVAIASPAPSQFVTAIGTTDARRLDQVRSLLSELPAEVKSALQDPTAAAEVVYALLVRTKPALQTQQIEYLSNTYGPDCRERVGQIYNRVRALKPGQDLLLLEALVPALQQLDSESGQKFIQTAQALSQPGGRLLLSNYPLQLILRKRLSSHSGQSAIITDINDLWGDALVVLALLARVGHTRPEDAIYAFKLGISQLPGAKTQTSPNQLPPVNSADINASLSRLEQAAPKLKQTIVDACAHTVLADNDVTPAEMGLLRAVVITLDCPAPPFLT